MSTTPVFDVTTVFIHADGTHGYKPLMLGFEQWDALDAQGCKPTLRYGYTREEADRVAELSLPLLEETFADFLAEGGRIENEVAPFFG